MQGFGQPGPGGKGESDLMEKDWTGKVLRFLCCMAVVFLLCGCEEQEEPPLMPVEESDGTITYDYCIAETGDVVLTCKLRGVYRQQKDQEISFSLTGRLVDKVYVEEGNTVKKGELLAELSAGTLERQIEDLEYRIQRNELLLEYVDMNEALDISQAWVNYLYNHFYDKERLDEFIADLQKGYRYQREDYGDALELDRLALQALQQELAYCRVYAGMDGIVYKLQKDLEGTTSREGKVIMTIVDNSECLFETEAPEYRECFKEGEMVNMSVTSGSAAGNYRLLPHNMEAWGEVQQFSVYDGPVTAGIEVGTSGILQFVQERRDQVLCVPKTAVHNADDKFFVYVADEDNMRQIRWVETGLFGDDMVEILSGLEEGEKVIRK